MIIDFHTHCFADSIAKNAVAQLEKVGEITAYSDGTTAGLLKNMERTGIDKSFVMPVATKPSQVDSINKWAAEKTDDKLQFFGAIHPDSDNAIETLQQLKKDGFLGIKLHPDYQGFFADEKRMMPVYDAARQLGLIVLLHAGVDIGLKGAVHCTPLMIRKILENIPGIKLIAAHMGSHALWRDVEETLTGKDIYLDTSYSSYDLKQEGMLRMIKKHGTDRILFGTDSPWTDAAAEIDFIRDLSLGSADIDKILYKNALTLLSYS